MMSPSGVESISITVNFPQTPVCTPTPVVWRTPPPPEDGSSSRRYPQFRRNENSNIHHYHLFRWGWDGKFFYTGTRPVRERERETGWTAPSPIFLPSPDRTTTMMMTNATHQEKAHKRNSHRFSGLFRNRNLNHLSRNRTLATRLLSHYLYYSIWPHFFFIHTFFSLFTNTQTK